MGRERSDCEDEDNGYLGLSTDKTHFGDLHPVSQSEIVFSFKGMIKTKKKHSFITQKAPFPYAEKAKSSRSSCVVCNESIEKDSVRIAIQRSVEKGKINRVFTLFVHPQCRNKCIELKSMHDLEERLIQNSKGVYE